VLLIDPTQSILLATPTTKRWRDEVQKTRVTRHGPALRRARGYVARPALVQTPTANGSFACQHVLVGRSSGGWAEISADGHTLDQDGDFG
jgi:hypothetical protein